MHIEKLLVLIGIIFLQFLVIVVQRICRRTAMKAKDKGIVSQIKEQSRLSRELEHTRIEKQALEKILRLMSSNKTNDLNDITNNEVKNI
jgi:hypothetical protein